MPPAVAHLLNWLNLKELDMALTRYKLGDLLQFEDERNSDNKYTLDYVKGISIQKIFI